MALDDIKGDDWEVRAHVHQNLVVSRVLTEKLRRGECGPMDVPLVMDFICRAIGDAAEMLQEDMLHHGRIAFSVVAEGMRLRE